MESRVGIAGSKRRKRTLIEGSVKNKLEKYFQKEPRPSLQAIAKLADSVRMKKEVVRIWFCNRRHKEKRMKPLTGVPAVRKTRSASRDLAQRDETVADESDVETVDENLTGSLTEKAEASNVLLTDEEIDTSATNELAFIPPETASVSNRPNAMLVSPDNLPSSHRISGSSFRNGRPWGPLSRRQLVEEELTEIQEASFELPKEIRFADRLLLKRLKKIGHRNHLDVHAVPLIKSDEPCTTFERFFFGNPDEQAERRTFLVLGANRTQAQFINGIVNYIFNVEQHDNFRFQLIMEEDTTDEMSRIKIYDVHHAKGFRVQFSITIVAVTFYDDDADDSKFFQYQNIAKSLLEFLEDDGGIQEMDMICNLISENLSNRSPLSIFGQDVAGNITNWEPFNYLDGTCLWLESIQGFFAKLTEKNVISLLLTQLVLKDRRQMEAMLNGLQSLLKIGNDKMEEVDKAKQMIIFCESQIQSIEEDEGNVVVELTQKMELPAGEYVYNCNRCYFTCHNSFVKEENKEQDCASSADLYESTATGFCSVCPDQCNLSMHCNQPFRWVYINQETRNQSSEAEMKWRDIKSKGRDLIIVLQKNMIENGMIMLEHFQGTWRCIQQLNKIALHGTSFFTLRVFDVLYNAEQQLKELGFQEGIESMKN